MVAIGKYVLLIDVNKVHAGAPPGGFTIEKPVMCHTNNLLEGVCLIGEHDEDVTDLAMPLYISSHIASASLDGWVSLLSPYSSLFPMAHFKASIVPIVGARLILYMFSTYTASTKFEK